MRRKIVCYFILKIECMCFCKFEFKRMKIYLGIFMLGMEMF